MTIDLFSLGGFIALLVVFFAGFCAGAASGASLDAAPSPAPPRRSIADDPAAQAAMDRTFSKWAAQRGPTAAASYASARADGLPPLRALDVAQLRTPAQEEQNDR